MKKHVPVILTTLIAVLIALAYGQVTKPTFKVNSSAVILRTKIENPEFVAPDNRNRWVWIKDGLALNAQLVTDDFLQSYQEKSQSKQTLSQLRKSISVNFTGGDEGRFNISVKGQDKQQILELNKSLLERLQSLVVESEKKTYEDIIAKLNEKLKSLRKTNKKKRNQDSILHYQRIINKMQISADINNVQSEKNFVVIKKPELSATKLIWPKKKFLLAAALLIGIVAGLFIEYLIFLGRKNDDLPA